MRFNEKLACICRWLRRRSFGLCCGAASVVLLCALLVTCNFGCNVIVNGEVIGTAPSKAYVQNLIDSINAELSPYLGEVKAIDLNATTTPKLLIGEDFTSPQDLGEILKSYCPYLEKAYTVKSNGRTVAAFDSMQDRQIAYDRFLQRAKGSAKEYVILDDISFEHELVPYGLVVSSDSGDKMLGRTSSISSKVSVDKNDELYDILTEFCISEKDFRNLNPEYKEGKTSEVMIVSEVPYIRVLTRTDYTRSQVIKHTTRYETDETMYTGTTDIKTEGKDGLKSAHVTDYSVNGTKLAEKVGACNYVEPVGRVMVMGTKPMPKGKSTGTMTNPCQGTLTSRFGSRWGRQHKGIDIGGPENSDVIAADGGTVVFAGWDDSGYGNMVKIEHQNGYTTLYAHCNSLNVAKGDKVNKGDVIAALGNTGRSTGPHVHFEVIITKTGETLDPLEFINEGSFN